jgi:hypothetical protein
MERAKVGMLEIIRNYPSRAAGNYNSGSHTLERNRLRESRARPRREGCPSRLKNHGSPAAPVGTGIRADSAFPFSARKIQLT